MNCRYMRGSRRSTKFAVEVGDVEQHAAVLGSAALGDLGVVGQGDAVARGELEPLRVVALHEALARGVAQDAALAAHGLGDQRPCRLLREDHPGRVELDELHVAQPAAGLGGQAHRVAGVLVTARGRAAPDACVAAGGEDDRIGDDHPAAPVLDVEAVGAEHAAFVHEQTGDVDVVADRDADLSGSADQRPLDLAAGVVACEAGASPAVRAEVALR